MRALPLLLLLLACTPTTTTSHYCIPLPHPHGYHVGQVLALFAPLPNIPDPQPLGIVRISRIDDAHLELTPIWLDPHHSVPPTFEIRDVPPGHHFGGALGLIIDESPELHRVRIDMGSAQGVELGHEFEVLGAIIADADLGGTSLGRRVVGRVVIVALSSQSATALLVHGEAPPAAFVVLAQDRVVVAPRMRILLTDFGGDRGPPYAAALRDALTAALGDMPEIMLETTSLVIENAEQAEQVGRDAGVDLVVWGSVSSLGEGLVIRPELTWLGEAPSMHIDMHELGPLELDEERLFRSEPDELSRAIEALARERAGR